MTRSSLRLLASTGFVFLVIACAKAEGGPDSSGDGDGDNPQVGSGGITTSSGGMVIGASGGATSSGGAGSGGAGSGGAATGGASTGGLPNLGGAPVGTGGAATGTGGEPLGGECAGLGGQDSVTAQGDFAVIVCPLQQSACPAEAVGEPALFECNDSHVNNCKSQGPHGGNAWVYHGLCTDTNMGGAMN